MLAWMRRRQSMAEISQPEPAVPNRQRSTMAGKYVQLYTYLENRFADTVVLTFAEIEDILGFTLPDPARLREEWWTSPDPNTPKPQFSDSWILANRSARPNMRALTVAFERGA
jgi:hypothetical protein